MKREWAIPVLLGLVVAAVLYAATGGERVEPPAIDAGHSTSSSTGPAGPIVLPFAAGNTTDGRALTFLVLAPQGRGLAGAVVNESLAQHVDLDWQGQRVALADIAPAPDPCGSDGPYLCPGASPAAWPLPRVNVTQAGPRFAIDGYNAGRVTAYVFDERGLLLASNADEEEAAPLAGNVEYTRLSNATWYMGANATAPNGTVHVPSMADPFVDRLRPQLVGLPVGGVATMRSNAYVNLYGTLFVTVRIDSLVHAP